MIVVIILKPSNVMIETDDAGRRHPVIMDFGIARETGANTGLTEAGLVMGTPGYMSPEQARGEVGQVDRRADVYSLGATLYDLLTGTPPFDGEALVDVLLKVLHQDPIPPRMLVASIPSDLETITLKCLAKESSQRYDSARALADDLQRYLDGEPIVARKSSLQHRLRRHIKKNKVLWAICCASFGWLLVLGIGAVRERMAAAEQRQRGAQQLARAQQLGQDIKEIEWCMRAVYELPLHDTTYEQGLILQRIAKLEQQADALGGEGGKLASYAIGRGYLALHESERAYEHLMQSWQSGNDSGELHYAIGRALGQKYYDSLHALTRTGGRTWQEARRQALSTQLLQPATYHLMQSPAGQLESVSYLKGLLAFYKQESAAALQYADRALAESPWLYEAIQLKGDILYERAEKHLFSDKKQEGLELLKQALDHYDHAVTVGRSDRSLYDIRAAAWLEYCQRLYERGALTAEIQKLALQASQDAITVSPKKTNGYQYAASIHVLIGQGLLDSGQDPRNEVKQLVAVAQEGIRQNSADAFLYNALGSGLLLTLFYEEQHKLPYSVSITDAISYQRQALAANSEFPWAHNDLAGAFLFRANSLIDNGKDPAADLQLAVASEEEALRLFPTYGTALSNQIYFHYIAANHKSDHNLDPRADIKSAIVSGDICRIRKPDLIDCYSNLALAHYALAKYLFFHDQDYVNTEAEIQLALANLATAAKHGDKSLDHQQGLSSVYVLRAQLQLVQSAEAPAFDEATAQAQQALASCSQLSAKDARCLLLSAELAQLQFRVALDQHRATPLALQQLLDSAQLAVEKNLGSSQALASLAQAHALAAQYAQKKRQHGKEQAAWAACEQAVIQSLAKDKTLAAAVRAAQTLEAHKASALAPKVVPQQK